MLAMNTSLALADQVLWHMECLGTLCLCDLSSGTSQIHLEQCAKAYLSPIHSSHIKGLHDTSVDRVV